jgi:hypothetical protein
MTDHLRSIEARLTAVEQAVYGLTEDTRLLRGALRTVESRRLIPPQSSPAKLPARKRPDLERLLGRFGMMIIAMIAAVAAVGTFLNWAIRWAIAYGYFTFGPAARVATGVAFAIALGAWGARLRRRERSFGSSVIALALVVFHVCAYSAGPSLHIVPSWIAFAVTAFVSWALAAFAHGENDELLWCVGFGGAAIASFVASNGRGDPILLGLYATVLLFWGCFAMSHREWRIATGVFYAASALFVIGLRSSFTATTLAPALAVVLPFVVAVAGVVPFAPESSKRAMLRWLALLAALSAFTTPRLTGVSGGVMTVTCAAAACFWLLLVDRHVRVPQSSAFLANRWRVLDWIDAAVIPFAVAYCAAHWLTTGTGISALFVGFAAVWLAFVWRRDVGPLRDAGSLAAGTCLVASIWMNATVPLDVLAATHLVVALVVLGLHLFRPSRSWLMTAGVALVGAVAVTLMMLTSRHAYSFIPFVTEPSVLALGVTLTLIAIARFWRPLRVATRRSLGDGPAWPHAEAMRAFVRVIIAVPWVWAFAWILIELAMAFDASTATLLLVVYFASTAVVCVGVGRERNAAWLRQIGLALAVTAAGTAFLGAKTYFDVAARIAAYLVTSAFLLGIAYWYRRPGSAMFPLGSLSS